MKRSTTLALLALLSSGCRADAGDPRPYADAPAAAQLDGTEAVSKDGGAPRWVTIAEQSRDAFEPTPSALHVSSDSLRVITTVGVSQSPYAPGLVVINFLTDPLTPPVVSLRGEPISPDSTRVDTATVRVPPGRLYFFIPQHYGLKDWRVVVQERRTGG